MHSLYRVIANPQIASLIKFCTVVSEKIAWRTDGQAMDWRKNHVSLSQPYHEGK